MSINYKDEAALQALVCEEFDEWSEAITVDQSMINSFAELSGDMMWMHVDEVRCAKESPFGCTIAHGFLLLSLLSKMPAKQSPIAEIEGFGHMMNYGSNRLRFSGAVTVDSQIHARSRVKSVEVTEGNTRITMENHINVVGEVRPALIYELVIAFI